jgi:hypothetical protein
MTLTITSLKATALALIAQNYPVFPLADLANTPRRGCAPCSSPRCDHPPQACPCHQQGMICHSFYAASSDPALVSHWWDRWPNANIGIPAGVQSGLVIVDIDVASEGELPPPPWNAISGVSDGWDSLAVIAERAGAPLPLDTVRVQTPSVGKWGARGGHFWFKWDGPPIPSSAGRVAWKVDIRANGGYAVAPPSRRRDGAYERICGRTILRLPIWLASLALPPPLPPRKRASAPMPSGDKGERYAAGALASAVSIIAGSGTRNVDLNAQAFSIGGLVGAGILEADYAEQVLVDAALDAGLPEREATYHARRGLAQGALHPRQIEGSSR